MTSSHSIGQTLLPRGEAAGTSRNNAKTLSRVSGQFLSLSGLLFVLSVAGCTTFTDRTHRAPVSRVTQARSPGGARF